MMTTTLDGVTFLPATPVGMVTNAQVMATMMALAARRAMPAAAVLLTMGLNRYPTLSLTPTTALPIHRLHIPGLCQSSREILLHHQHRLLLPQMLLEPER